MFEAHKIDKINFNFNYNGFNKAKKFVQTNIVSKKYVWLIDNSVASFNAFAIVYNSIPMTMHWTFQINYVWEKWKWKRKKKKRFIFVISTWYPIIRY